jgi:hypothetical protein
MNIPLKLRFLFITLIMFAVIASPSRARAEFVFNLSQVGNNVVVTGLGTLNLAALTVGPSGPQDEPNLVPFFAALTSGSGGPYTSYNGVSGPPNFGTSGSTIPTLSSGDVVGIFGINNSLQVPFGYVSGSPLSDTSTFTDATIGSLGLTPGQYLYTWGTGATADSLTVNIVPEPSTALLITFGCSVFLGVCWIRRRRVGRQRL